ncbi:MAG: pilus assembly protein PilP [Pseudomonadota bacterium]|nr:pilus assembly protein PilP [Pseudomonadota bacterium]
MSRSTLLIATALTLTLAACGSGMSDLEQYAAEIKSRTSTAIPPIPQLKQFESFLYVPGDRRDPFVEPQPEATTVAVGPRPDMNRNREPLEEFPLDGLRMSGTIQTAGSLFALIRAPDGVIHRVTTRNYMGQNFGQIIAITGSEIKLQELVPDGFGGWAQRDASLALSD